MNATMEKVAASDVAVGDQISSKKSGDPVKVGSVVTGPKAVRLLDSGGQTIVRPRHGTQLWRVATGSDTSGRSPKAGTSRPRSGGVRRNGAQGGRNVSSTPEDRELAQLAQKRCNPGAAITGPNIAAVRLALNGKAPVDALPVTARQLATLSTGSSKPTKEQRDALREFAGPLGRDTFYGKKLASMLWAIQRDQS